MSIQHGIQPLSRDEAVIPVAAITGTTPAAVQGYAVIVDDGTPMASIATDLDLPHLAALLAGMLELLAGGAR